MEAVRLNLQDVRYSGRTVLRDVDISLMGNQRLGVIGPSGVGKSTILNVISGFHSEFSGQCDVFGMPVSSKTLPDIRQHVAFLFQQSPLIGDLTVYENLKLSMTYKRVSARKCHDKIMEVLKGVDLLHASDFYPDELSGGMRRRVVIAIALLKEPKLLLCDEPFTGQDPLTKLHLLNLLDSLQKQYQFAMILVSHDVKETLVLCPNTAVIMNGGVSAMGSKQVLLSCDDQHVVEFIEQGL